jgi:hypothetical protein
LPPISNHQQMLRNLIQQKPYIPLAAASLIIALIAWLRKDYIVDLQYYDTYYIVPVYLLAALCAMIMLISSLLYWFSRMRPGIVQLTTLHVLGTIAIALYLTTAMGTPANAAAADIPMSIGDYRLLQDLNFRMLAILVILGVLQLLLVVNIAIKLVRR